MERYNIIINATAYKPFENERLVRLLLSLS